MMQAVSKIIKKYLPGQLTQRLQSSQAVLNRFTILHMIKTSDF
jgi:hypothetical protein